MPVKLRRPRREDDSAEWQLTLADMMTLILCFFVVIAAVGALDTERYREVAKSMSQAMGAKDTAAQRANRLEEIAAELAKRITADKDTVEIERRPDAIALNLRGPVFFGSGQADLRPAAQQMLAEILGPLMATPYTIVVEGHTDDVPISSDRFPSNWELSAARAASVARFLVARGFPPGRVQVLGLADTRPLQPNRDQAGNPLPDNQAVNRRVTILFKP